MLYLRTVLIFKKRRPRYLKQGNAVFLCARGEERYSVMKKIRYYLAAAIVLAAVFLSACGSQVQGSSADSGKLRIVTTIFPEYDWVMNVLGDNPADAEVTLLLDNGVDLHSFQPSADDILTISTCDLFVYVGGESDAWVDDALKEALNKDMVVINLMDVLGDSVKEEEVVEGMQEEEEEEEEGETEYDEHVWLSLRNTSLFTEKISDALETVDPEHADIYQTNTDAYCEKLDMLDKGYQDAVAEAEINTLLFGDRFPFRYLVDDYGLDYYAAFVGCSAETEASFDTVIFLAQKVDELQLPAVMTIEGGDKRIAETIVENTKEKNQKILTMDSMQSTTAEDMRNGINYLSVMESNLAVMREALGLL